MIRSRSLRRAAAAATAAGLALLLAACFVLPGKFASTLDIRKNGHFTYAYKGEIVLMGLTRIAQSVMAAKPPRPYEAVPCHTTDLETERPCTKTELAKQKTDWDTAQAENAKKQADDLATFKQVFSGIDPNDPKAADQIAERLRHQTGWNSVIYKGNGIYDVDVSIAGVLDRDFEFPTIERIPGMMPFVVINRRSNGEVRIDSPLMQYTTMGMPGGAAAQVYAQQRAGLSNGAAWPSFPQADGHLTLTTDGVILSSNTEHGPSAAANGKQLDWDISGHNPIPPMALIGLGK